MIRNYLSDFGPFDDNVWLNCAHQGPLPRVAAEEAYEAISWKRAPHYLTTARFTEIPLRLKQALGSIVGVSADEIILGNSASYGLHLLANGICWQPGDEVLLVQGDFPSDILPWLALERKGVKVRLIQPRHHVLQADELRENITPATKLLCATLVHSFSGFTIDAVSLGEICQSNNTLFVLNISQALGARSFHISDAPIDAITCVGFKWLCGPYGTGFCWMKPELRESLEYNQAYWLAMQTADDLAKEPSLPLLRSDLGARRYDVFGTANFFNFKPWSSSLEYIFSKGVQDIEAYDQELVSRFIEGLDVNKYNLLSPRRGITRSTLIFISHKEPNRNGEIYKKLTEEKIFLAYRAGKLRLSPHLYNTNEDIDAALSILNDI